MSSWQLDANGDLDTSGNRLKLTSGLEANRQRIQCKFRLFLSEWFLDTSKGVPYFQNILVKNPVLVEVTDTLKSVILNDPAVIGLESFEADFDELNREFSVEFRALTDDGPIDFSQVVEI